MVMNIPPMFPLGVQAQMARRPPGFSTRANSWASVRWSGTNMQPNTDVTTSKLASSKGSFWASPSIHSISTPASFAAASPASSSDGVRSMPVTVAPVFAAGMVALPLPQATSRTTSSPVTPAASTARGPTVAIVCIADA